IPARVVDLDQTSVRVSIYEPQLLEDFQAARSLLLGFGQLFGDARREARLIECPGGRIVGPPRALPVDRGEDDEPIGVVGPQIIRVLAKLISQAAVQTDTNGDIVAVHDIHELAELFLRATKA